MSERKLKIWRVTAIIALCALLTVSVLYAFGVGTKSSVPAMNGTEALSLWNDGTGARDKLIDYVNAVTQEGGSDFIPVEDRIAVFDMDGTLTCETFYTYYDTMMFIEYCLYDHPERVSDELKAVAASIQPGYVADETLARNFAKAYAGMTVEEFYDYVVEFGQKKTASFNNMRYIDGFYLPMVELVKYLYDNGFEIWVISGTERTTTRAIVANSPIRDYVEPEHVIGTDFEVKQRGHEDEPSNMDFKYENGDELVLTGGFIQKNLNGNKSIWIEQEIGQRPVLAFGNSGSDTSMMNYCLDGRNPYLSQAYMVVADDGEREWGTQDWETKSADYLAKGYIPISMKRDFARIYPDGVTKAAEQYVPASVQFSTAEVPAQDALDYGDPENWAYFELGEDREVDVFLICPTVDTRSETNSFDLNDKLRGNFIYALDLERGIFDRTCRLFSPYYRQMSINAYMLPENERVEAREIAYADISAAFRWYLRNENDGRGIILAGFSQGGEMCLELLKEYYGGDSAEAQALREQLIAVYSIGWMVTEEMTETWPQIVPATGETDTGTVVCFDCEDGNVSETIIIPAGMRALSINPLNWKTDSTPADKSLNRGAVFEAGGEPIPALCGAYIGERGELIVTDVTAADYPPGLELFPEGAYHLYDYMFFFTNLKENVALRTAVWSAQRNPSGALAEIRARGVLRVGTAGDYQPMSYLDPESGMVVGFDAALAEDLAAALGIELEYVPTSWPTLMEDTLAGNFDLAICGITITQARQEQALMSIGYLGNGKTVLCRAEDADKYTSLEAINRPEVRVMENPGGLNEKFARENLPNATLIIHDVNQEIPGLIAAGEADVMITEIMEAGFYVGQDERLAAPLIYEPFTHGQLGVLMPKGSEDLLAYVNTFLEEEIAFGRIDELAEEYIYQYISIDDSDQLRPAA